MAQIVDATAGRVHPHLMPRDALALASLIAGEPALRDVGLVQQVAQSLMLPELTPVLTATDFKRPQAVAPLPDGGMVVADRDTGALHLFTPHGTHDRVVSHDVLNAPISVDIARDGSILVCDMVASTVCVFEPSSGHLVATVTNPLVMLPKGCVELANGDRVVCSYGTRSLVLWRRDDSLQPLPVPLLEQPGHIAIAPCRTRLYVHDDRLRHVIEVVLDVSTPVPSVVGEPRIVSDRIASEGLAVLSNGTLLISDTARCQVQHRDPRVPVDDSLLAMYGMGKGTEQDAFDYPVGLCPLPGSRFAVCDKRNMRVAVMRHSDRVLA